MIIEEILDLPLREILENYCTVCNLECGYYYGVFKIEDIDEIFEHYNVNEYEEAFQVEDLIHCDVIGTYQDEVRDYNTLVRIMENLGVSKK